MTTFREGNSFPTFIFTMRNKNILFIVFFFILCSTGVMASFNYTELGGNNQDYVGSSGDWNTATSFDSFTGVASLDDLRGVPLVADLDLNGKNEIVVHDDDAIKLFNQTDTALALLDSINLNDTGGYYSNMIVFNIDDDAYNEIIVYGELDQNMEIYEYNGTHFYIDNIYNLPTSAWNFAKPGQHQLGCVAANDCALHYTERRTSVVSWTMQHWIIGFNSTQIITPQLELDTFTNPASTNAQAIWCLPKYRSLPSADIDNDGTDEYVASVGYFDEDASESVRMYSVHNNGTHMVEENSFTRTFATMGDTGTNPDCEDHNLTTEFTAPLLSNIDGAAGNGIEIVFANQIDDENFRIYSYDSNLASLDQYPLVENGEGTLISNVFLANAFPDGDTNREDFCVIGQDTLSNVLELVCGSEQNTVSILGVPVETVDFDFDSSVTPLTNLSNGWDHLSSVAHSAQMSSSVEEGTNLDEIVTSWGVFELDYDGTDHLDFIYQIAREDGVVIPVDYEKVGKADLIIGLETNLWYLDDGFVNSKPEFDGITVNPCLDTTWQQNTLVEVRPTATDPEGDDVKYRVTLYHGDANNNNVTINTTYVASGTTSVMTFTAANITANSVIRFEVADTDKPNEYTVLDSTFAVDTVGETYPSLCTTNVVGLDTELEEVTTGQLNSTQKQSVRNAILASGTIDEDWSPIMASVIIMLFIWTTVVAMGRIGITDGPALIYIPIFVGVVAWTGLVIVGMIPAWTVMIALLLSSATIGFKVYTSGSGSV